MNRSVMVADVKNVVREPVILGMYSMPIFLFIIMKSYLIWGHPIVLESFHFDITAYQPHVLMTLTALTANVLGMATGFMMLDDRDARIYELMQITPLGRVGYLINRMMMPVILSMVYVVGLFMIFNAWINLISVLTILIFVCVQVMIFGLILFFLAEDKVKGLTYAKVLNLVMLTIFADFAQHSLLIGVAKVIPTYWLLGVYQGHLNSILWGIVVHGSWFGLLSYGFIRSKAK